MLTTRSSFVRLKPGMKTSIKQHAATTRDFVLWLDLSRAKPGLDTCPCELHADNRGSASRRNKREWHRLGLNAGRRRCICFHLSLGFVIRSHNGAKFRCKAPCLHIFGYNVSITGTQLFKLCCQRLMFPVLCWPY